jgi:hypothetical protein
MVILTNQINILMGIKLLIREVQIVHLCTCLSFLFYKYLVTNKKGKTTDLLNNDDRRKRQLKYVYV